MTPEPLRNQTESSMAWDDLRTSPAFPAIVGGLAGAVGGVALMFVLSRMFAKKERLPAAYDTEGNPMNVVYLPPPEQFRILGFTIADILTLGSMGIALYRQVQNIRRIEALEAQEQESNAQPVMLTSAPSAPTTPPPTELPKGAVKK